MDAGASVAAFPRWSVGTIRKCGLEFGSGGSVIIDKPESVMRLSVVIFDALAYCLDDNNFK